MEKVYKNKWDKFSAILTIALISLILYIAYRIISTHPMTFSVYFFLFFTVILFVLFWSLRPYKATTDGEKVIIHTVAGKETFTINRYKAQLCPKSDFPSGIRLFASGGLFGYTGKWRSKIGKEPRSNYNSLVTSTDEDIILLKHLDSDKRTLLNAPREWFGIK